MGVTPPLPKARATGVSSQRDRLAPGVSPIVLPCWSHLLREGVSSHEDRAGVSVRESRANK